MPAETEPRIERTHTDSWISWISWISSRGSRGSLGSASTPGAFGMIQVRVAVLSALNVTSLSPLYCVWHGASNALSVWLRRVGVHVVPHVPRWRDALANATRARGARAHARRSPLYMAPGGTAMVGTFLRLDIPILTPFQPALRGGGSNRDGDEPHPCVRARASPPPPTENLPKLRSRAAVRAGGRGCLACSGREQTKAIASARVCGDATANENERPLRAPRSCR